MHHAYLVLFEYTSRMHSALCGHALACRCFCPLQMDIEGYEHQVVSALVADYNKDAAAVMLPDQISLEVHYDPAGPVRGSSEAAPPPEEAMTIFYNFAAMGYTVINREDNPFCPFCGEFTVVRTACHG
jgi:hypothetical protein